MTVHKTCLGDGAYVDVDDRMPGAIVLTTSDGISDTNTIYLGPDGIDNLLDFLKHVTENQRRSGTEPQWMASAMEAVEQAVMVLTYVIWNIHLKRVLKDIDPKPRLNFWRLIYGDLLGFGPINR